MIKLLLLLLGASAIIVAAMLYLAYRQTKTRSGHSNFPSFIFAVWVVSTIVWGGYYYSFHLPGLFDLTIERVLFLAVLGTLVWYIYKNPKPQSNYHLEVLMAIFWALCVFSMMVYGFSAANEDSPKPWYIFLVGYFAPFIAYYYVKRVFSEGSDYRMLFRLLFAIGVYLAFTAIFEKLKMHQFVFPKYIINDPSMLHMDRARGPFLNAAFNGVGINIGFLCGVYIAQNSSGFRRIGAALLLLPFFPAIYYTHTRSVYLHFVITLLALLFCYRTKFKKWKVVPLIVCFIAFALVANMKRFASTDRDTGGLYQVSEIEIRFQLIKKSMPLILHNPAFGVGLAQFASKAFVSYQESENQHNHIIGMMAELGFVGTFLYCAIIGVIFRRAYVLSSYIPDTKDVNQNFLLLLVLMISVALVNNSFVEPTFSPFTCAILFIAAGIIDGLYVRYVLQRTERRLA